MSSGSRVVWVLGPVVIGACSMDPSGVAFDVFYDDIVLDTKRVGCL